MTPRRRGIGIDGREATASERALIGAGFASLAQGGASRKRRRFAVFVGDAHREHGSRRRDVPAIRQVGRPGQVE
jgi:hypothetical protein